MMLGTCAVDGTARTETEIDPSARRRKPSFILRRCDRRMVSLGVEWSLRIRVAE